MRKKLKKKVGYLFLIFLLAIGLVILISIAQVLAKKNISGLKTGNREAAITFTVNNRLQEVINLSFELESKVMKSKIREVSQTSFMDSLTMLGYNMTVLDNIVVSTEAGRNIAELKKIIDEQVNLTNKLINLQSIQKQGVHQLRADSIRNIHFSDSVYAIALKIKQSLEHDLQQTIAKNSRVSSQLSTYNRVLALIAIFAVVLLGTIIVNRHFKQIELINALKKAKTEALESSTIKDQFLANMSHEIRTPLHAISGFSKLLSMSALNNEQRKQVNIIHEASNNLSYIVNDILDISKLEAGKLTLQQKEFSLEKVVRTVKAMFDSSASEKKISVHLNINHSIPPFLLGDPERVSQVLINLLSNAIKFTQHGGQVQIDVYSNKETDSSIWIVLIVEDSGIGIPSQHISRIFNRFEQLSADAGIEITHGTGLGLSIVKNLVELMKGEILVKSNPGKGSEFIVKIPFRKTSTNQLTVAPGSLKEYNEKEYQPSRILIVEDNKINQLLLINLLEKKGLSVTVADNGAVALALIQEQHYFDLIFLDIQMPVMDGYAFIKQVQKLQKQDTPVIAMTAFASESEKEKCLSVGMTEYLTKPLDFTEFYSILEKYLGPPRSGDPQKQKKKKSLEGYLDHLLSITGNDPEVAQGIIKEIHSEIPAAINILEGALQYQETSRLNRDIHYLVSTFSPLGNHTFIMQQLHQIDTLSKNGYMANGILLQIRELIKGLMQLNDLLALNQSPVCE